MSATMGKLVGNPWSSPRIEVLDPGGLPLHPLHAPEVREPADAATLLGKLSRCDRARDVGARLGAWLVRAFEPCRCRVLLLEESGLECCYQSERSALMAHRHAPGSRRLRLPIHHNGRDLGVVELELPVAANAERRRWLEVLVHAAAAEIGRLEAEARATAERERAENLERYVPGAISSRILRGEVVSGGEREVTILFLDVRSYIARVSLLRCSQVFRWLNRYIRAASAIVLRHGGAVTEFDGDGLMAVFGAPNELAERERAAVRTALELVDQVPPLLGPPGADGDGAVVGGGATELAVGIGIASGRGFVGDVIAADRLIWTVVGHTTNLAARLQGLTRDLATTLVLDEPTWRAAGELVADFERRPALPVRGFPDPIDVYTMPRRVLRRSENVTPDPDAG
jgi:class 3 adenylate cyclase